MAVDAILNPIVVGDWVALGNGRISSVKPRIEKVVEIDGNTIKAGRGQFVNSFRSVNITHLLYGDLGNTNSPYTDLINAEITEDDYLAVAFTGVYKPRWFGAKLVDGVYKLIWIGDSHQEGVFDSSGSPYSKLKYIHASCLKITDVAQDIVKETIDKGIENLDSGVGGRGRR